MVEGVTVVEAVRDEGVTVVEGVRDEGVRVVEAVRDEGVRVVEAVRDEGMMVVEAVRDEGVRGEEEGVTVVEEEDVKAVEGVRVVRGDGRNDVSGPLQSTCVTDNTHKVTATAPTHTRSQLLDQHTLELTTNSPWKHTNAPHLDR